MTDRNEENEEILVQEHALDRFIEDAYRRYAILTISGSCVTGCS